MCLDKNCYYIEIVEMPSGNKLYIHYDRQIIPIWIECCDIKFVKKVEVVVQLAVVVHNLLR